MSPMTSIDYITIESECRKKIVSRNFWWIFFFQNTVFLDSNAGCGGGIQGSLNSRYCGGYLNDLKDAKGNVPICGKYNLKFMSNLILQCL